MKRTAIIMAGGSGERFWPISRRNKPKQLLKLASDKTMLEDSIERISPLIAPEDIFIITGRQLLEQIRRTLPMLPPENIVAEPYKRNTAPCLALGAAFIMCRYAEKYSAEEISIAVLTADQIIYPNDGFIKTVKATFEYVEKRPVLATIGITPWRVETGYGYIEVAEPFDDKPDTELIKPVISFREKPDAKTAEIFINSGNFLWNSGMFFWRSDVFTEAMKNHFPEVGEQIDIMTDLYRNRTDIAYPDAYEKIAPIFESFPNESIDYALMEKAERVVVSKALFKWDDVGSWDSLERVKTKDNNGNIIEGPTSLIDCKNSIIINNTDKKIVVAGAGLEDMVIVASEDAIMICPKNKVQDVKKCVSNLQKNNGDKWL